MFTGPFSKFVTLDFVYDWWVVAVLAVEYTVCWVDAFGLTGGEGWRAHKFGGWIDFVGVWRLGGWAEIVTGYAAAHGKTGFEI